ncbi:MAG: LPS assembly protein LptD [Alphaproteobacteria bacterium]|nr:LPS assembly protein LptD [Alphaproteobacteria bacterium]
MKKFFILYSLFARRFASVRILVKATSCLLGFFILYAAGAAQGASLDADAPKTITADKIEYDVKAKSIQTTGKTTIVNQTGQRVTLVDAYLGDRNTDAGGRNVVMYLSLRTRVTAERLEKNGDITIAKRPTYTTCANCGDYTEAWHISASKLKHNNVEHELTFYDPVLWFYDVPVFWFPRMDYPDPTVKYKSGFLFPYLNSTNNMGMQINLPLYLNFSDYHDATIIASYLTAENPLWQAEHRLNLNHSSMLTRGSYTRNQAGADRWHVFNNDRADLGDNARIFLFFDRTSDKTYLQQYDFYNDQPYLDSGARLEMFATSGYATTEAHFFQELRVLSGNYNNPSGDILPNIHGVYQTAPFYGNTYLSFMGDVLGINKSSGSSQRLIGSAQVVSPWVLPMGQKVTLALSARYDAYNFINTQIYGDPDDFTGMRARFLPSGYAEWSLPFIRIGSGGPAARSLGEGGWTHILEPKARLTIQRHMESPGFVNTDSAGSLLSDAMLFSDNRLAGYDLWANGNYADYGINWTAFSKNDWSSEVFLGASYDFYEPSSLDPNSGFHDGMSDYVGRIGLYSGDWLRVLNRFRFANENMALRHLESTLRVGSGDYVEAGYIRATQFTNALVLDRIISEALLGGGIYLTTRLSARARVIYNITDNGIQRLNAGLYYDHPCYTMSLDFFKDGAVRIYPDGENYYGGTRVRFGFALKLTEDSKYVMKKREVQDYNRYETEETYLNGPTETGGKNMGKEITIR